MSICFILHTLFVSYCKKKKKKVLAACLGSLAPLASYSAASETGPKTSKDLRSENQHEVRQCFETCFFLLESAFPTELDFFWVDTWLSDSFKEGEEGLKLRILKDYEFLFWKKYVWICCILRNKQFKHKMNHLDKPKTGFVLQNSCYRNTKVNLQEGNFFELLERGLETKMIMFLALYCCKQAWFFELTTLIKVFLLFFFFLLLSF